MSDAIIYKFGDLMESLNEVIYYECDENQFLPKHKTKKNEAGVAIQIWEEHFTKLTAELVKLSAEDPTAMHGMACREVAVAKVRLHLAELIEEITYELTKDA